MQNNKMHAKAASSLGDVMAMLTVRNLPDDVHRALKARAAQRGRSTEAEVREILEQVVKPQGRIQMGDALAALGRRLGLTDQDVDLLQDLRDRGPTKPLELE
jgi:plasmid stability protein